MELEARPAPTTETNSAAAEERNSGLDPWRRIPDLIRGRLPFGRSTLYAIWESDPTFPEPAYFGSMPCWRESWIAKWENSRPRGGKGTRGGRREKKTVPA
jgi:hypothetical protein